MATTEISGQVGIYLGTLLVSIIIWMSQLRLFIDQYGEEGYYGGNFYSGRWTKD